MKIGVLLIGHARLDNERHEIVAGFIEKRLRHHGFDSIHTCANRESAQEITPSLLKQHPDGVAWIDVMNPIVDIELLEEMAKRLLASDADYCVSDGAIPGTQPDAVLSPRCTHFPIDLLVSPGKVQVHWGTQEKHNNQFNLYKYKRLKVFLGLNKLLPDLAEMTISNFCDALSRDDVFLKVLSYFTEGALISYDSCQHCGGSLDGLKPTMSQPMLGYLPSSRSYYFECRKCGLIQLSPALEENSLAELYDDFDSQDFVASTNNPYQPGSPRCDLRGIANLLGDHTASLDLGGGLGRFSQYLKKAFPTWDVTHSDFGKRNVELESEGIRTRALNFLEQEIGRESYDFITAHEVIEHIPFARLDGVFGNIHDALRPGGLFRFSTPDFDSPLCRAFDYYNACPPFHYSVFRERWLRKYFEESGRWTIVETKANSDFLDDAAMWFDYTERTSPGLSQRSLSTVLKLVFSSPHGPSIREYLLQQGCGTEIVMTLRKR